jgi:hypothetical protein
MLHDDVEGSHRCDRQAGFRDVVEMASAALRHRGWQAFVDPVLESRGRILGVSCSRREAQQNDWQYRTVCTLRHDALHRTARLNKPEQLIVTEERVAENPAIPTSTLVCPAITGLPLFPRRW